LARGAVVVAALLLTLAFGAAGARADADPASDYLIQLDSFFPFSTKVSSEQKQALNAALASGRKAGVPIKVAVIAAPNDLGAVTVLFRKPHQYAKFLGTELSYVTKARVLVVMPNGYGIWRGGKPVPPREVAALRALPPVGSSDGDKLTAAANTAVRRLLALHGVRVAPPPATHSSTTSDRVKIASGALALVAIGLGASMLLRRRRRLSNA
jgi:hypothetical protein